MALINKLEAIGDAIRGKTGKEEKLTLDEMVNEIEGISDIPDKFIHPSGDCSYLYYRQAGDLILQVVGDKIESSDITLGQYMFSRLTEPLTFDVNLKDADCTYLLGSIATNIPVLKGTVKSLSYLFNTAQLTEIGDEWFQIDKSFQNSQTPMDNLFRDCHKLRKISPNLLKELYSQNLYANYRFTNNTFYGCNVLDEVVNFMPPQIVGSASGVYGNTFNSCYHIKRLVFVTNGGEPMICQFKSAVLDLSSRFGHTGDVNTYNTLMTDNGLLTENKITDDASYQALKDNPDAWTGLSKYSRYNKVSAIETINSLPDTSAYGTNTIKFQGSAGSSTDGGAINTMTAEEIAVATSKGWTVSFA